MYGIIAWIVFHEVCNEVSGAGRGEMGEEPSGGEGHGRCCVVWANMHTLELLVFGFIFYLRCQVGWWVNEGL